MTRGQIKSAALRRAFPAGIGLPEGSHRDPFLVDEELNAVCEEVMRGVHEAYLFFTIGVVANDPRYCWPPLYEIDGADILPNPATGGTTAYPLRIRNEDTFKHLSPGYLDDHAVGAPGYLVTEGKSSFVLVPTPDYTLANALTLRGLGLWSAAAWAADTAACPLPVDQHQCLVYGLASRLATDHALRTDFMGQFRYLKGHLESEMAAVCDAARARSIEEYGRRPSGPLDL